MIVCESRGFLRPARNEVCREKQKKVVSFSRASTSATSTAHRWPKPYAAGVAPTPHAHSRDDDPAPRGDDRPRATKCPGRQCSLF